MLWQQKKVQNQEVSQNLKRKKPRSSIKTLLERTKWIYKYGMPLLFFMMFGAYYLVSRDIYSIQYTFYNETFGASLMMCYREYYEAVLRGKCMWQKGSILSIATFCIMNIVFTYYNYDYSEQCKFIGLGVGSLFIVGYLIKEELYDKR